MRIALLMFLAAYIGGDQELPARPVPKPECVTHADCPMDRSVCRAGRCRTVDMAPPISPASDCPLADHAHIWGSKSCTDWSGPVNGCQHRMCYAICSHAGCDALDPRPETRNCGGSPGSYSTAMSSPWQRGGSEPSQHVHDLDGPICGSWSRPYPKEDCQVRHCTYKCRTCNGNFKDYLESEPAGCF